MTPYTTEDYKKYVYALGKHRVRRLYDSVATLGVDIDISTDITCSLGQLELWLTVPSGRTNWPRRNR